MPPSVGFNIGVINVKGTLNCQGAEKQPPPKPPPIILPVRKPADDFVGRSGELKRLADLLLAPEGGRRAWIVGLAGSGGIGKSALAFQFAALHQADFPGGVIGCQVNGKDLAAVAREFARKAGEPVREEDGSSPADIMQNVFAWRRALLIFDNAETTEIGELHPGGQCAVLVTTRDRRLPVIIGAELLELPPLPEPEARVLLARFVGEARLNKEPEAAARILAVTGNLPLAVQIAGKFLQNRSRMPLKDYADSLSLARLTLARTDKESEDKNFSVRVCFNESVRLLEAEGLQDLTECFARLAACAQSGFALSTAMAAMDEPDSAAALDTLEELRNYSLLNYAGESGSRFLFHPLLHEFAGELAKERDELAGAKQRHAAHCGRLLEDGAGNELAEDVDDLVRAAAWVAENWEYGWAFYLKLKPLFDRLGRWEEGERTAALFLRRAEQDQDAETAAQFYVQQAKFRLLKGDFAQAEAFLRQADELIQSVEQEEKRAHLQAMQLNSLGGVHQRLGQFDKAIEAFSKSAEIGERLDDQRHLAMVLNSLGGVYQRLGQFDKAVEAFSKSYELLISLGDQRGQAMVLNSLGGVYQRLGQFDKAVEAFSKSAELEKTSGSERGQAMVLNSLGGVFQRLGQFDKAVEAFSKSAEIGERLDDQRHLAMVLNSLGGVFQRLGQFDKAVEVFSKSVEIGEELKDQRHLAMVSFSWGRALLEHGQPEAALAKLEQSFAIDETLKDKVGLAIVTPLLCQALRQLGHEQEAADRCDRALALAPGNAKLLALQRSREKQSLLTGTVKFISPAKDGGHSFGYLSMDDGGADVRFDSRYVDIRDLSKGARVAAEVRTNRYGGRVAARLTKIT